MEAKGWRAGRGSAAGGAQYCREVRRREEGGEADGRDPQVSETEREVESWTGGGSWAKGDWAERAEQERKRGRREREVSWAGKEGDKVLFVFFNSNAI